MTWIETDYSKHSHFRWKTKWRLEHLGTLGSMGEMASLYEQTRMRVLLRCLVPLNLAYSPSSWTFFLMLLKVSNP